MRCVAIDLESVRDDAFCYSSRDERLVWCSAKAKRGPTIPTVYRRSRESIRNESDRGGAFYSSGNDNVAIDALRVIATSIKRTYLYIYIRSCLRNAVGKFRMDIVCYVRSEVQGRITANQKAAS